MITRWIDGQFQGSSFERVDLVGLKTFWRPGWECHPWLHTDDDISPAPVVEIVGRMTDSMKGSSRSFQPSLNSSRSHSIRGQREVLSMLIGKLLTWCLPLNTSVFYGFLMPGLFIFRPGDRFAIFCRCWRAAAEGCPVFTSFPIRFTSQMRRPTVMQTAHWVSFRASLRVRIWQRVHLWTTWYFVLSLLEHMLYHHRVLTANVNIK